MARPLLRTRSCGRAGPGKAGRKRAASTGLWGQRQGALNMNRWVRRAKQGFTLIELMIVVAIIGILAVLAIYGVRKYMANAKTAEARNSLGQIGKDQSAEFEKESMPGATLAAGATAGISRSLCQSSSANVPPAAASIAGKKYQSSQVVGADWSKDETVQGVGFSCLKFSMDAPQYFMYGFVTRRCSGSARA